MTSALEDGPVGLGGDLVERVELSWERATSSWWVGLAVLALLAALRRARRRGPCVDPSPLDELAAPLAFAAAIAVSMVVNDSPTDVLLVGYDGIRRLDGGYASRAMARVVAFALAPRRSGRRGSRLRRREDTSPTPETVIGDVPTERPSDGGGGGDGEGDPAAGKDVFASAGCGSCHTFADAGTSGTVGPNLDQSSVDFDAAVTQITNGGGGMPRLQRSAERGARSPDVAAYVVSARTADLLPPEFPREVDVLACDLDRTLIWEDGTLRPRTLAAIGRARHAGITVRHRRPAGCSGRCGPTS